VRSRPHCSTRGVRKAGATIAVENGATERQLMWIFGWPNPKQATRETMAARIKKLTRSAMALIEADETGYKEFPPVQQVGQKSLKSQ
jgi:hypothetical protein